MECVGVWHPADKNFIMKRTFTFITIIFSILFSTLSTKAQSLLTPFVLFSAHELKDSASINLLLKEKGYKPGYGWGNTEAKVSNWIFQTKLGEDYDFKLRMIITPKQTTTYYWIISDFYYQEFMKTAIKDNYKFVNVQLIDKQLYFVFKNGDKVFYTNQERNTDSTIYTVLIQ